MHANWRMTVTIRLPIQKEMLQIPLRKLAIKFEKQHYLCLLYQANSASVFYRLLRVRELTMGDHPMLAKEVHIATNKDKTKCVIHTSETHEQGDKLQTNCNCMCERQYNKFYNKNLD